MKKLYSLIRACMTSDMNLFKIKTKKNSKSRITIPLVIALYLMFVIWGSANTMFEKIAPMNIQYILLALFAFGISVMTIIEGIYKTGPLIFNCKDDQLLLSLPISRRTVLFVRVFKFYVFEVVFNSLFLLPIMIAYIRWAPAIDWTYYLTSIIMLFMLPIIPIVISCIFGVISASLTSRFKYKNIAQIIISMVLLIGILYGSYKMDDFIEYLMVHATSVNEIITKIYYPAGMYVKLITEFNVIDLITFMVVNIIIFGGALFILSKVYFKINSRLKKVTTNKKVSFDNLVIKARTKYRALIRKELNTFFKTPVFIVNSGFALVLFILCAIIVSINFDDVLPLLTDPEGINLSKDMVMNNLSIMIFVLLSFGAYMTSITNSLISLERKNINILKSLPIKVKTILMSKVYACLIITTPVLLVGDMLLFIVFKIAIIEAVLLVILSILIPLVSHFIGLLVNLKYPKLDAENSTEIVKQSISSFISVMIGMILLITTVAIVTNIVGIIKAPLILAIAVIIYLLIDIVLYLCLISKGVKEFNSLTV